MCVQNCIGYGKCLKKETHYEVTGCVCPERMNARVVVIGLSSVCMCVKQVQDRVTVRWRGCVSEMCVCMCG